MNRKFPTRRDVVRTGLAAAAMGPMVVPSRVLGESAPSKRIALGSIGVGWHGYDYNLKSFLREADCRVVAVCDVYGHRRDRAAQTVAEHEKASVDSVKRYADFRELLADGAVDAVVISTPDHWHVPLSLAALDAGKDVFCEKPTLTIAEGRTLVERVAQRSAVFQTGLEDRSVLYYHRMAEVVRNGGIGTLRRIDVTLPSGTVYPAEEPAAVPDDLDWNLWLGPAPHAPYTVSRTKPMNWRNIRDYSGGLLTDWGAHLVDTALVGAGCNDSGPIDAEGTGVVPPNAMNTVPVTFDIDYTLPGDVKMNVKSGGVEIRFTGDDGWIGNQGWRTRLLASDESILRQKYDEATNKIWPRPATEHREFLDCVKSRKATTYTAEQLHRLSTTLHVGAIAMHLGRRVRWDAMAEAFIGDDAANGLRSRAARDWAKA